MAYLHSSPTASDPGLGWSTQLRRSTPAVTVRGRVIVAPRTVTVGAEGHEVITRMAFGGGTISFTVGGGPGSHVLSATDQADIILGNRSVDLGTHDGDDSGAGVTAVLNPGEQRRHALRSVLGQTQAAALADIRSEFVRQHAATLAETDPRRRMRRIGVTLHLIQDAYSPAHVDRDPGSGNCIRYIRNYGRGSSPAEHGTPTDSRDSVSSPAAIPAVAAAASASRGYLQIVLKALRGGTAAVEAAGELPTFMATHFRAC
jgi:hypothetical protein